MNFKAPLIACCFFILLFPMLSVARMPSPGSSPADKTQRSEIILVVESIGHVKTEQPDLNKKNIENLRVVKIIKGDKVSSNIMFVTTGFTSENNSQCCEANERYLVFLDYGYRELEEINGDFYVQLKERDKFVSGADNAWSTYQILDEQVVGWPFGGSNNLPVRTVIKEIKKYIKSQRKLNN